MISGIFFIADTSSSDPWDLNNMNKSLPAEQQRQQKDRKTPQDFLGENANLVNLDQLVTKSESAGTPIFSSPELKAQVSFSVLDSSLVHCPVLSLTFYIFVFFSRTTVPISTKLGIKHSWLKGIQVYSNEFPNTCQRGDNSENILTTFLRVNFTLTWHKASLEDGYSSFKQRGE